MAQKKVYTPSLFIQLRNIFDILYGPSCAMNFMTKLESFMILCYRDNTPLFTSSVRRFVSMTNYAVMSLIDWQY